MYICTYEMYINRRSFSQIVCESSNILNDAEIDLLSINSKGSEGSHKHTHVNETSILKNLNLKMK